MSTYQVKQIIDDEPTFEKPLPEILAELKAGGALKVLSPIEYHTDRQHRWYKGICVAGLSHWSGETKEWWDRELKKRCFGAELLKKESWLSDGGLRVSRLTTVGVGKKNFTQFIKNILSEAIKMDWPILEPDPELRSS